MSKPLTLHAACSQHYLFAWVLVFLSLSTLPASSQTCGPPTYSCVSTSNMAVQTPAPGCTGVGVPYSYCSAAFPPFSGATGYNTVGYDTSLNPTGTAPILRASDSSVLDGHSPISTPSGGDNDEVFSCTGRADTNYDCAHATLYFVNVQYGGCDFVAGVQTTPSFQVVAPFPPHTTTSYHPSPCGGLVWAHTNPNVAYFEGANSGDPTIYKVTYSWDGISGHSPTFTQTTLFDLGKGCQYVPNQSNYGEQWSGPLSLDITDNIFAYSTSNVRGIVGATASVGNGGTVVTITASTLSFATPNVAGSGYVVGDYLTVVQSGASGGTLRVATVNGSGGITSVKVVNIGQGYSTASGLTVTGGSGSGATVNVTRGLLTDGSLTNAIIKLGTADPQASYTILSNTSTTVTLSSGYTGTDCQTSCPANIPNGQGTGVYIVAYDKNNGSCSVYNTYTGQVKSTGSTFETGPIDSGCHGMYIHDGFLMRDGEYGQWSGASTGTNCGNTSNFWETGTTHAVSCTGTTNTGEPLCAGHNAFGYHNEVAIANPSFYNFPPENADNTGVSPFGAINGNCENHFSWRNATSGDTEPVIGSSANNNYSTSSSVSSWNSPGQNEVYALTQNGTLIRFGHNFVLGPGNGVGCGTNDVGPFDAYFTAQYAIGAVSQDGRLFSFNSSMLGQLSTDSDGNTRADVFVYYLGKP